MQQEIIVGVIVALVAAVFGWSLSQLTIGRKISEKMAERFEAMNLTLQKCDNDNNRTKDELAALRSHTMSQITSMTGLVQSVLDTANKLIDVVSIQNALLQEKLKKM